MHTLCWRPYREQYEINVNYFSKQGNVYGIPGTTTPNSTEYSGEILLQPTVIAMAAEPKPNSIFDRIFGFVEVQYIASV